MKRSIISIVIFFLVLLLGWYIVTRVNTSLQQTDKNTHIYSNGTKSFSIILPEGYTVDELYQYTMNPQTTIDGVKFTIPATLADGTNLGHDSYISVEHMSTKELCSAKLFLDMPSDVISQIKNSTTYLVASSSGAGAGNRYEEIVYSLQDSDPCTSIRYFIHYSNIQNYDPGAVKEFDIKALKSRFDLIRDTLIFKP